MAPFFRNLGLGCLPFALCMACSDEPPVGSNSYSSSDAGAAAPGIDAGSLAAVDGDVQTEGQWLGSIDWEGCATVSGRDGPLATCAMLELPLLHAEPDGARIDFFLKRLSPVDAEPTAQLWLLAGGPGAPGHTIEQAAALLHEHFPDFEMFVPDHRGTGRSTLFECETEVQLLEANRIDSVDFLRRCPVEIAEAYGEEGAAFNATEAARDVVLAMQATQREGVPIFAYGASYGAYWLHRILQVSDSLVTSAVLDSPLRPDGNLSDLDRLLAPNMAGEALLERCATNEACAARLGSEPVTRALTILEQGWQCEPLLNVGFTHAVVQDTLIKALRHPSFRNLVPAVLHRFERCEPGDVDFIIAFQQLTNEANDSFQIVQAPGSHALNLHILRSEVVTAPVSAAALDDASMQNVFADSLRILPALEAQRGWPGYEADEWAGRWANTTANVLTLQSQLDTQVPMSWGRATAQALDGENQYYVEFVDGAHGVTFNSPEVAEGLSCGMRVLRDFLLNPDEAPSSGCADDAEAFEVRASDSLLRDIAGHTDPWDNP